MFSFVVDGGVFVCLSVCFSVCVCLVVCLFVLLFVPTYVFVFVFGFFCLLVCLSDSTVTDLSSRCDLDHVGLASPKVHLAAHVTVVATLESARPAHITCVKDI